MALETTAQKNVKSEIAEAINCVDFDDLWLSFSLLKPCLIKDVNPRGWTLELEYNKATGFWCIQPGGVSEVMHRFLHEQERVGVTETLQLFLIQT